MNAGHHSCIVRVLIDKVSFPSQAVQTGAGERDKRERQEREHEGRDREGAEGFPRSKRPHPITGGSRKIGTSGRPQTPSLRSPRHTHSHTHHVHHSTGFSSPIGVSSWSARPVIQRANSSGGAGMIMMTQSASMGLISPAPRSAKRWARSAHLHEVKSATIPRKDWRDANHRARHNHNFSEGENVGGTGVGDVFGSRVELPRMSPRIRSEGDEESPRRRGPSRHHYHRGRMSAQKQIAAASENLQFEEEAARGHDRGRGCSEGDVSEGEGWVDTDVGGSDLDVGGHEDEDRQR